MQNTCHLGAIRFTKDGNFWESIWCACIQLWTSNNTNTKGSIWRIYMYEVFTIYQFALRPYSPSSFGGSFWTSFHFCAWGVDIRGYSSEDYPNIWSAGWYRRKTFQQILQNLMNMSTAAAMRTTPTIQPTTMPAIAPVVRPTEILAILYLMSQRSLSNWFFIFWFYGVMVRMIFW